MFCFSQNRVGPKLLKRLSAIAIISAVLWFVGNREYKRRKEWWDWKEYHDDNSHMRDKVIVMAKLEKENTDWVAQNLPE
jgi:CRISPR/Cas system-associated endonuclease/helicase Cas3